MHCYNKPYLIFFFLILFIEKAAAQADDKSVFCTYLQQMGLTYEQPQGFTTMKTSSSFFYYKRDEGKTKRKYLHPLSYRITSESNNIIIGFDVIKLDPKNDSSLLLKAMFPGRSENTEYLLKIRAKADTLNGDTIHFYSPDESKTLFNADKSGTYSFTLEVPYEGKYNHCRIIFMHKDNRGDAEAYYFYNDEDKDAIKSFLKNTYKMIHFNK